MPVPVQPLLCCCSGHSCRRCCCCFFLSLQGCCSFHTLESWGAPMAPRGPQGVCPRGTCTTTSRMVIRIRSKTRQQLRQQQGLLPRCMLAVLLALAQQQALRQPLHLLEQLPRPRGPSPLLLQEEQQEAEQEAQEALQRGHSSTTSSTRLRRQRQQQQGREYLHSIITACPLQARVAASTPPLRLLQPALRPLGSPQAPITLTPN